MRIPGVHFLVAAAIVLSACGTDDDTSAITRTPPTAADHPGRGSDRHRHCAGPATERRCRWWWMWVIGCATIPVENTADSIAIADDAVWVAGWDGQLVSRIDVDTNEVVTVDVGATGTRLVRRRWRVGRCRRWPGAAARPAHRAGRGDRSRPAGRAAAPLSGDAAVWVVTSGTSTLTRVDPVTNEVTATIDVAASGTNNIRDAVTVDGTVWVSLCEGGVVSVDEQTLAVSEPVALDGCAGTLSFTDESLWVALDDQRTARVDPVARR